MLTKITLILVIGSIFFLIPVTLPVGAGDWDFQAYWSSAYLLAHGQDFSDSQLLANVEHTLTTRTNPETLYSWFSPIGNVVLIPFTLIPFTRAVYYWLILNIVILFVIARLIWRNSDSHLWIPLLTVFSFSMTVVSLVFGQINFMEVLGLVLFLSFNRSNKPYLAGASLVLTTIKPHLVLLTLPILLLDLFRKKEWKPLTGFFAALAFCFAILFTFYPPWMQSFWTVVTSGMSTVRESPGINGILVLLGSYKIGKWIWIIALAGGVMWWWKRGLFWDRRTFIDISLVAGLILSPIGWSYDQIMLLLPILSILSWVSNGQLPKSTAITAVSILIMVNLISYQQRTFVLSEVWFFWVPLIVLGLYLFAQRFMREPKSLEVRTTLKNNMGSQ